MDNPDPTANVPDYLKCPICMDLPKKKVFQCHSGHTVCEECHARLDRCPLCRVSLGSTPIRNLAVEKMLDELSLDCPFKESGCSQKLDRKSLEAHVQSCSHNVAGPTPMPPPARSSLPTMPSSSLESVIEINARDPRGDTQLHRAVAQTNEDRVKQLILELGADVHIKNGKMQTPLHIAGKLGSAAPNKDVYLRIIKFLIENGTDVFAKDDQNMTFLHNFLGNFSFLTPPQPYVPLTPTQFHDLADYLIDMDHKELFNTMGWEDNGTPLHWAVQNLEVEEQTLILLHVFGVNFNAVSKYGDSVVGYARMGNRSAEFISILTGLGAR